jgi:DNA-directed RNA polymerase specialized sigma24 family protein
MPRPASPRGGDALLTAYARSLVQFKARQLCRKPGFGRSDQPDVEQDLVAAVVQQSPKYDPARGASPDTFADRVIDSAVKMILRSRRRVKRAAGFRAASLDTGSVEHRGKYVPLTDVVGDADGRTGKSASSPADAVDAPEAVRHALAGLPPLRAGVARHLQDGTAVSAIARQTGVSRRQVYAAMAEIRRRLEAAGLGS